MSQGPMRPSLFWKGREAKPYRTGWDARRFGGSFTWTLNLVSKKGNMIRWNTATQLILGMLENFFQKLQKLLSNFGWGRSLPSSDIQESSPWSLDCMFQIRDTKFSANFRFTWKVPTQLSHTLNQGWNSESQNFPKYQKQAIYSDLRRGHPKR